MPKPITAAATANTPMRATHTGLASARGGNHAALAHPRANRSRADRSSRLDNSATMARPHSGRVEASRLAERSTIAAAGSPP